MEVDFSKTKPKQLLVIEMVPETSWFTNLRSMLTQSQWDKVRKQCYTDADYECQVCGNIGPKWPVECHEIWSYDDKKHIQTLKGLIALCPDCHMVKHMGLTQIRGLTQQAMTHMAKVNDWNLLQVGTAMSKAFEVYHERGEYDWTLDTSWLQTWMKDKGIKL